MRAVILAAGRGSRLQAYTERAPKCLAELGGMTLIGRQLATLRDAGITDIVIATGYRGGMLEVPGTRRVHNPRWETTNMVGDPVPGGGRLRRRRGGVVRRHRL